jgi:hypothetical protein
MRVWRFSFRFADRRNQSKQPLLSGFAGSAPPFMGEMDSANAGSVHRLQAGEDVKVKVHLATGVHHELPSYRRNTLRCPRIE